MCAWSEKDQIKEEQENSIQKYKVETHNYTVVPEIFYWKVYHIKWIESTSKMDEEAMWKGFYDKLQEIKSKPPTEHDVK